MKAWFRAVAAAFKAESEAQTLAGKFISLFTVAFLTLLQVSCSLPWSSIRMYL